MSGRTAKQAEPIWKRVDRAIADRFLAGDSVSDLARDYEMGRHYVEDVLRRTLTLRAGSRKRKGGRCP